MEYIYGVLDLSLFGYLLVTFLMVQATIVSVTLYLHRDQAHRGVDMHPLVRHFCRFWLWMTTGINTKEWVAIHRKHHARCETEEDPHSPQTRGLRKVLLQGAELYQDEARNEETLEKYGRGCPDDWLENRVYTPHGYAGLGAMFVLDLVLFGLPGISIWAIQMMAMPLFAAGIINGLGHYTGYRNFECADASRNITPVALLLGGEELHNNHHAFPSSARFSVRKWEFDIGFGILRVLSFLRLANVRRVAPRPVINPVSKSERSPIDFDTLRTVMIARMHVLRDYSHKVTLPVLRGEMAAAPSASVQKALRMARKVLVRQPDLLDEAARARLRAALDRSQALATVHEFRERLQTLWSGANVSNERLLAQLRDWCAQAEASGIRSLQEFSASLRGYSLQTA